MSGRPRTPVGTYGNIILLELEPGKWRARTYYRFSDGKSRQVQRFGATKGKATNILKAFLIDAATPTSGTISKAMNLSMLADAYLKLKEDTGRAPRTISTYRHNIESIIKPRIGQLAVGEATTMRVQQFITLVEAEHGHGSAKGCRSVLSGMLALAIRSDAISVNPVQGVAGIEKKGKGGAKALGVTALPLLLATARADAEMNRLDLADLWEFMALCGCRIGEALALRWSSIDFDAKTISLGPSVNRVRGKGLFIYEDAKTKKSERTIVVPDALIDMLRTRMVTVIYTDLSLVFPSMLGKLRDTSNTEADWASNRDRLGYPGFTSHGFRKTVATALDAAGLSARDVAEYLGHKNPSMTQDVYMSRNTQSKKAAAALNSMFGISAE